MASTLGAEAGGGVELVAEPFPGEAAGELDADDALPEAQHLGVVGQDRALDGEAVMGGDSPDAGHLVGADGHPEPVPQISSARSASPAAISRAAWTAMWG